MVNRKNVIAGRNVDRHPLGDIVPLGIYSKTATVIAGEAPQAGIIETPEGQMTFQPGDFIVTDNPPTHAWPVRGDVFRGTYVKITDIEPGQIPTTELPDESTPATSAPPGDIVEQKLQGKAEKAERRGIASSETLGMNAGES